MKMYHIKSEFPALIEKNDKCFELDRGFYIEAQAGDKLKVYPLSSRRDCYNICYAINLSDDLVGFDKVEFPDYTEIYIKERFIARSSVPLLEKSDGNGVYKLSSYPHCFFANIKGEVFEYKIKYSLNNFEIKTDNKFVYLFAKSENKDYLLLFNKKNNNIYEFCAENIEIKENKLIINQIKNNFAKHAITLEYELSENFKELSRKLYYTENKPKITNNPKIIPYAFLEAVEIEDYNLARTYLSKKLNEKIDNKHLKAYFGEINRVVDYMGDIAIIDSLNKVKIFKFEIIDELITKIEEI